MRFVPESTDRIWFPVSVLDEAPKAARSENGGASDDLDCARQAIAAMHRPVILVDDYVLRYDGIEAELHRFSQHLGAPVLQVRYRRGPMLFERIRREYVPAFAGWYDPWASEHRNLMAECDGLILLEDRNMYRRVVGGLPSARKVAISSDASKTVKNQILVNGDVLVEGNVLDLLRRIGSVRTTDAAEIHVSTVAATDDESCPDEIRAARRKLVATMAAAIVKAEAPVLVDDSQMFGGLIATQYDLLPPNLRIFGAHGGFVGAGIAYATGLAIAERRRKVFCTLGDQGFTNGLQGLVSAAEQNANVWFIACNNGGSVSLLGQSKSEGLTDMEIGPFLGNVTGFDYLGLARSLSIAAFGADLRGLPRLDRTEELAAALNVALGTNGPTVVELKLPPDPDFWQGIWLMKGFDGI